MAEIPILMVWEFRVMFQAINRVRFPAGKAANTLRGALGFASPKISSSTGLSDPPKPFLLRAAHLDGQSFEPSQSFFFDLILFKDPSQILPDFVAAFQSWSRTGIGPALGRVSIESLTNRTTQTQDDYAGRSIPLIAAQERPSAVTSLTLDFLTPTELKSRGEVVAIPQFPILIQRLSERIGNLQTLYQNATTISPPTGDPSGIEITRTAVRHVDVERRSSRTRQRHGIGGFVGEVEYSGDLGGFIPILKAGEWTGVGRQTVWGKGQYRVRETLGSERY